MAVEPQASEPVSSPVLGDLKALSSLAVRVLNEHTNHADVCAVCGCAWACEGAVLAENNLAVAL